MRDRAGLRLLYFGVGMEGGANHLASAAAIALVDVDLDCLDLLLLLYHVIVLALLLRMPRRRKSSATKSRPSSSQGLGVGMPSLVPTLELVVRVEQLLSPARGTASSSGPRAASRRPAVMPRRMLIGPHQVAVPPGHLCQRRLVQLEPGRRGDQGRLSCGCGRAA